MLSCAPTISRRVQSFCIDHVAELGIKQSLIIFLCRRTCNQYCYVPFWDACACWINFLRFFFLHEYHYHFVEDSDVFLGVFDGDNTLVATMNMWELMIYHWTITYLAYWCGYRCEFIVFSFWCWKKLKVNKLICIG